MATWATRSQGQYERAEAMRLCRGTEGSLGPPTYYLPRAAFGDFLTAVEKTTFCEWKGVARYVDVVVPNAAPLREVGWWYPEPDRRYPEVTDRVAVHAGPFGEITLDGEVVEPQPGGFYGGWVTKDVVGPFKGVPGSWGW